MAKKWTVSNQPGSHRHVQTIYVDATAGFTFQCHSSTVPCNKILFTAIIALQALCSLFTLNDNYIYEFFCVNLSCEFCSMDVGSLICYQQTTINSLSPYNSTVFIPYCILIQQQQCNKQLNKTICRLLLTKLNRYLQMLQ